MNNIFGTKYPIVCAPMFQINDCNLALAVHNSGCLPSFIMPTFGFDYPKFVEPKKFIEISGSNNFNMLVNIFGLSDVEYQNKVLRYNPKYIDITTHDRMLDDDMLANRTLQYFFNFCKDNEIKLTLKTAYAIEKNIENFDIINIKGSESAGRYGSKPIKELFLEQKKLTPHKLICPSGGISTYEDIDWFLENGADAVSIGSAFALTKESRMNIDVKNKILKSSSSDLAKVNNRNAFIVGDTNILDEDENKTLSLIYGISNKGGHVYMGKAIDKVNELLSVQELVNNLVSNSKHLQCLV
jgi:hypothetical protein